MIMRAIFRSNQSVLIYYDVGCTHTSIQLKARLQIKWLQNFSTLSFKRKGRISNSLLLKVAILRRLQNYQIGFHFVSSTTGNFSERSRSYHSQDRHSPIQQSTLAYCAYCQDLGSSVFVMPTLVMFVQNSKKFISSR